MFFVVYFYLAADQDTTVLKSATLAVLSQNIYSIYPESMSDSFPISHIFTHFLSNCWENRLFCIIVSYWVKSFQHRHLSKHISVCGKPGDMIFAIGDHVSYTVPQSKDDCRWPFTIGHLSAFSELTFHHNTSCINTNNAKSVTGTNGTWWDHKNVLIYSACTISHPNSRGNRRALSSVTLLLFPDPGKQERWLSTFGISYRTWAEQQTCHIYRYSP